MLGVDETNVTCEQHCNMMHLLTPVDKETCCAEQEDLCHHENGQFRKLKQAQAQMVASLEGIAANKSIDSVCTKMQDCRAR